MFRRLIGWKKKRPLHLRHEPSFVEQQQPLSVARDTQTETARPHPAERVPTLSIEQARHRYNAGEHDDRQPITTLDALDQIRKKESDQYPDLGVR